MNGNRYKININNLVVIGSWSICPLNFWPNCMKFTQSFKIYIPNKHVSFYLDISKTLSFIENNIIRILQTSTYAKRYFSPL